ncbi:MarR family winged helix-turn-helix transcriptional regulator [Pararhodobacter marinus]|uniref:MarR family winged helix-turn-helix transcriptional regulator n=1 Tax=Pararhodobacter marinus TaxID=2184063 RepID=UPI0035118237
MADSAFEDNDTAVDPGDLALATKLDSFFTRPGFLIRRANQISNASFAEDLGSLGLTPTQMSSLAVIVDAPGIDQITLARRIGVDRTTISMVVNGLTQHGFIHRERSPLDARRNELNPTRAGTACMHLARDHARSNSDTLLKGFSPDEVTRLRGYVRRLVDEVQASPPEWIRPDGIGDAGAEPDEGLRGHSELYQAFGFMLRRAHQTLEAAFVECAQSLSLTPRRYGVLRIVETCQPLEQISLARWLSLDGSTAASVVTELARRDYLSRKPSPTDRRRRLLQLTDLGRETYLAARPLAREASLRATRVLAGDADDFTRLMQRFIVQNESLSRVASQRAVIARAAQLMSAPEG